jgi:protein-tyrosine kinase
MSLIEQALLKRRAAQGHGQPALRPDKALPAEPPVVLAPLGDPARRKSVDFEALRQARLLPTPSEERAISHQFQAIKRPLIRAAFAESDRARPVGGRSIMVTSALPGDGKTFTSLNLALSMALERDHSVILVDGDVAKPHVSQLFHAEREPGLLDVLEDPARGIGSVILPTDVENLCVLPVGRQSPHATELLASDRMRNVIRELESLDPRSLVLVDSPPVLLTNEARVLAGLCAQVVLVVRATGTPRQAVLDAVKLIGEGPRVNLVLNQALHAEGGGYYGYGSGYAYGENMQEGARQ